MFEETDFNDLSPKMQGLVASSIKCAALELVEILPDEPTFKENTMKNLINLVTRAFSSQPCPLEDIKSIQSEIKAAYDGRIGKKRQTGILAGYRTRSEALRAWTYTPRSIR